MELIFIPSQAQTGAESLPLCFKSTSLQSNPHKSFYSLLLQKEGSGLLPARLSVRLLFGVRLQTHAGVTVQPAEWEVRGADPRPLPLLWTGAALHHSHQTQLLQEQLELRR